MGAGWWRNDEIFKCLIETKEQLSHKPLPLGHDMSEWRVLSVKLSF